MTADGLRNIPPRFLTPQRRSFSFTAVAMRDRLFTRNLSLILRWMESLQQQQAQDLIHKKNSFRSDASSAVFQQSKAHGLMIA